MVGVILIELNGRCNARMCCIFFMSYKKDILGVSIGLFLCKSDMFLDMKVMFIISSKVICRGVEGEEGKKVTEDKDGEE